MITPGFSLQDMLLFFSESTKNTPSASHKQDEEVQDGAATAGLRLPGFPGQEMLRDATNGPPTLDKRAL